MAHHGRGRINATRAYRMHPRRDQVTLLNKNGTELCFINDAPWGQVSTSERQEVINYDTLSRTFLLPVVQCGEYTPVNKYRLRSATDNTLWEIVNQPSITNSLYKCVCIQMNEHDQDVP